MCNMHAESMYFWHFIKSRKMLDEALVAMTIIPTENKLVNVQACLSSTMFLILVTFYLMLHLSQKSSAPRTMKPGPENVRSAK